jgi:hypothetical protein
MPPSRPPLRTLCSISHHGRCALSNVLAELLPEAGARGSSGRKGDRGRRSRNEPALPAVDVTPSAGPARARLRAVTLDSRQLADAPRLAHPHARTGGVQGLRVANAGQTSRSTSWQPATRPFGNKGWQKHAKKGENPAEIAKSQPRTTRAKLRFSNAKLLLSKYACCYFNRLPTRRRAEAVRKGCANRRAGFAPARGGRPGRSAAGGPVARLATQALRGARPSGGVRDRQGAALPGVAQASPCRGGSRPPLR